MLQEIEGLQALGWYQEHYQVQKATYRPWNDAVWNHQWHLIKDACLLCHSVAPSIRAGGQSLCLTCLSEFPNVPWHPTGSTRPKVATLINHAATCPKHSLNG